MPPTRVATTGNPAAMASITVSGMPSLMLVRRKRSAAARSRRAELILERGDDRVAFHVARDGDREVVRAERALSVLEEL